MATITTDTYLDAAARTAGETWTITACKLLIRTDTRWHANSPASMTGVLGSVSISNTVGGEVYIDGSAVRWLAYNSGSGNVPAVSTSITQGGVTGVLLGVWADYTSAPTAVGAAMPATGYIKFREVTGGAFSAGALTGIGASATGADVTGWIEVVLQESSNISSSAYSSKMTTVGDWFYLDNTNGTPGQTIQTPTNGGGSNTIIHGVQIETSPGSNTYEWYDAVNTTYWLNTYFNTDVRNKRVENAGGGLIRIGATSGAVNVGYTPASGCKVRMPNILLRGCTAAARATNVSPNSTLSVRPMIGVAGTVSILNCVYDWTLGSVAPQFLNISNTCLEKNITATATKATLSDVVAAQSTTNAVNTPFLFTDSEVIMNNVLVTTTGSTSFALTRCFGSVTDCAGHRFSTTSSQGNNTITACHDLDIGRFSAYGSQLGLSGACDKITITDTDYIMRLLGDTTATNSATFLLSGTNITVDGLTFGRGGVLSNCNPYTGIFQISSSIGPIYLRNIGSITTPLSSGSNASFYPGSVVAVITNNTVDNLKVQRVYVTNLRSTFIADSNGVNGNNNLFENIGSSTVGLLSGSHARNTIMRGMVLGASVLTTSKGIHWRDYFSSAANTGTLIFNAVNPTTELLPYMTLSVANTANSGFNASTVVMINSGDYLISETPYFILGHASFQNVAPTVTSTGSYTNEYQIDTGSGWNGTWKTLNASNLSGETISPSTGFKIKIRITVTATSTSNVFTSVSIATSSTSSDRLNLYPLDTSTLSFTGLQTGTEVRCYTGTDPATSVEIGGVESTAGSTFSFNHSSGGVAGYINIFALGYQPITIPYTYSTNDDSILIQQVVDRNYVNP